MNKKRTLATIIGIVLTSCLLFTVSLGAATIRQINIDKAIRNNSSHHVIFNHLPYSNIDTLKKDKNINKITVEKGLQTFTYNKYDQSYSVNIVTDNVPYSEYITLSSGSMPSKDNEIIISFTLAQNKNYQH
jgi:putative ABC transport system permease protein